MVDKIIVDMFGYSSEAGILSGFDGHENLKQVLNCWGLVNVLRHIYRDTFHCVVVGLSTSS